MPTFPYNRPVTVRVVHFSNEQRIPRGVIYYLLSGWNRPLITTPSLTEALWLLLSDGGWTTLQISEPVEDGDFDAESRPSRPEETVLTVSRGELGMRDEEVSVHLAPPGLSFNGRMPGAPLGDVLEDTPLNFQTGWVPLGGEHLPERRTILLPGHPIEEST